MLVNILEIQRDSKIWDKPNDFKSERIEEEIAGCKFMPFGMGRTCYSNGKS